MCTRGYRREETPYLCGWSRGDGWHESKAREGFNRRQLREGIQCRRGMWVGPRHPRDEGDRAEARDAGQSTMRGSGNDEAREFFKCFLPSSFPLSPHPGRRKLEWIPPPPGMAKIRVDGEVARDLNEGTFSAVCRDTAGTYMGSSATGLGEFLTQPLWRQ